MKAELLTLGLGLIGLAIVLLSIGVQKMHQSVIEECGRLGKQLDSAGSDALSVRIAGLTLNPGDSIVIACANRLTAQQVEQIRAQAARFLPDGVKTLVMDGGLTLSHVVSTPRDAPAQGNPVAMPHPAGRS